MGHVVKCWNHPDSDKLLCEEIDLGEAGEEATPDPTQPNPYYTISIQTMTSLVAISCPNYCLWYSAALSSRGFARYANTPSPCNHFVLLTPCEYNPIVTQEEKYVYWPT